MTCREYVQGKRNSGVCAVGTTESFKIRLHQESALSLFLYAVIMNRLADKVKREPLWTMLFADDIVICKETREEVEWRLECWRYALETKGMKVRRSNICAKRPGKRWSGD